MIPEPDPVHVQAPKCPADNAIDPSSVDAANVPTVPLKIEDWLTVIVMAFLACITFANVVIRYFTSSSFAWTEEISIFLMIVLAMVAGSAAVARNHHICIEYFASKGSAGRQRFLARFGSLVVFAMFALLVVLSSRMVWDDFRFGETSPGIGVPQWWYTGWLPLLSLAIALRALGVFIRRGRSK